MAKPKLSEEMRGFIVQALACYDAPSTIAAAVLDRFGVKVTRQRVESYNAERPGQKPARRWVALFTATRSRFHETVDDIPIANKAVRLRRLDRMAARAEDAGNLALAAGLLEQAAKEVGGAYGNRLLNMNLDLGALDDEQLAYLAGGGDPLRVARR